MPRFTLTPLFTWLSVRRDRAAARKAIERAWRRSRFHGAGRPARRAGGRPLTTALAAVLACGAFFGGAAAFVSGLSAAKAPEVIAAAKQDAARGVSKALEARPIRGVTRLQEISGPDDVLIPAPKASNRSENSAKSNKRIGANEAQWRRHAAARVDTGNPKIAIVIDDVGLDKTAFERVRALPAPLTLSFLPYAKDLPEMTASARAAGHELMVHMPMEPKGDADPGPMALKTGHSTAQLQQLIDWNLSRFEGYVGFNNHMGSRLTADSAAMRIVLTEARERGLVYLDSLTTPDSDAGRIAVTVGAAAISRDVFLDPDATRATVRRQLEDAERIAERTGLAIAIAHPRPETLDILGPWLVSAPARGFDIIAASQAADMRLSGGRRFAQAM
ncbi:MAG: divergent polysaccharide deacetylase family protein [Pseudomonadota bacterium]